MLELGSSGSARGVCSNVHPYRDPRVDSGHQGVVRKFKEFRTSDRQCISALDVGAVASESTEGLADDCRIKVGGAGTRSAAFLSESKSRTSRVVDRSGLGYSGTGVIVAISTQRP